jgi:formate/nitrite transporter FocA (FNT family)
MQHQPHPTPQAAEPAASHDASNDGKEPTERQADRQREDQQYTQVIIKRSDQATRHPDDVLQMAIERGETESQRTFVSLVLSAVAAGAILAFSVMGVGAMATFAAEFATPIQERLLEALVYPLGFVLVILSGSQLFTEHTALAVYPVLDRRATWRSLGFVWTTVLLGNLIGCVIGALLLAGAEDVIASSDGYAILAQRVLEPGRGAMLVSAILAGWLMALGGWLVLATPPSIGQMVAIYIVTFLIGLGGLHHSIVGSAEVLAAVFTGYTPTPGPALSAFAVVVIGNLLGGSIFVAVLNYAHIRKTQYADGEAPIEPGGD